MENVHITNICFEVTYEKPFEVTPLYKDIHGHYVKQACFPNQTPDACLPIEQQIHVFHKSLHCFHLFLQQMVLDEIPLDGISVTVYSDHKHFFHPGINEMMIQMALVDIPFHGICHISALPQPSKAWVDPPA